MLGDFTVAFAELGSKFRGTRETTIVYLEPWCVTETIQVIDRASLDLTSSEERLRLTVLARSVRDEGDRQPYGDLVFHPLFLQFILEDVVEQGVGAVGRPALIQRWVERKLRRDRVGLPGTAGSRVQIDNRMDTDEYVARACRGMRRVAYEMSTMFEGQRQLLEGLPSEPVIVIMGEAFGGDSVDLLPLLLNSVLTPLGPRRGASLGLGFALRVLQEYFAASYLVAEGLPTDGWPVTVCELAAELAHGA
jgi:hypothetical protein